MRTDLRLFLMGSLLVSASLGGVSLEAAPAKRNSVSTVGEKSSPGAPPCPARLASRLLGRYPGQVTNDPGHPHPDAHGYAFWVLRRSTVGKCRYEPANGTLPILFPVGQIRDLRSCHSEQSERVRVCPGGVREECPTTVSMAAQETEGRLRTLYRYTASFNGGRDYAVGRAIQNPDRYHFCSYGAPRSFEIDPPSP